MGPPPLLTIGFLLLACLLLAVAAASTASPQKIRGAALGGWLLLEKFIATPVMAGDSRIIDEWTFGLYANASQHAALRDHWASFVTEEDFARMREAGLTHVRIPFGYWHLCTQQELDLHREVRGG